MTLKRVKKAIVYITCGDDLLVFRHRDFPDLGIQVPAGTIEPGEDISAAALREAEEETGLPDLKLVRYLGSADYDISALRPEMHERHFFHVVAEPPVPEKWRHDEIHPSGGDRKSITYDCFWVKRREVGKSVEDLFFGQGAMLDRIDAAPKNIPPENKLK